MSIPHRGRSAALTTHLGGALLPWVRFVRHGWKSGIRLRATGFFLAYFAILIEIRIQTGKSTANAVAYFADFRSISQFCGTTGLVCKVEEDSSEEEGRVKRKQGGMQGAHPTQQPPPQQQQQQQQQQQIAAMVAMQQQMQMGGAPMHGGMPLGAAAPPAQHHQSQVFEFLPGVASLVEDLDKRVLVTLRDGRHFVGMFGALVPVARLHLARCQTDLAEEQA